MGEQPPYRVHGDEAVSSKKGGVYHDKVKEC